MSDEKQKKQKGMFSTFWTKVEDLDSSKEAASSGAVAAGYLAISYALQVLLLYFSGETLYSELTDTVPADKFEYYFQLFGHSLITILFIFVAYRIYKQQKFGFIPFLSLWVLYEVGYKFYLVSGRGIVLSLIFAVIAINSFRGWLGIRRYQKN